VALTVTTEPDVSVVVPTYNRVDQLRRVLDAFERQTIPPSRFEVVVVSDGSTDGTDDYLASLDSPFPLRVVGQRNQGPAAARNRGVQVARGPIVLFVDDDVVATPSLIEEHLQSHEAQPCKSVVIGPMITPPGYEMRPWVAWEQRMLSKQYDAMNNGVYSATFRQFYTGNASVPRAEFLSSGGFDTRFRRAEDVELAYRLDVMGIRWVWNPNAIGHHYADRPFDSWLRTARDYGANEIIFSRDQSQDPGLARLRTEFSGRSPVIKALARLGVAVPSSEPAIEQSLRALAWAADSIGATRIAHYALSALFNTAYYRAMAAELGGPRDFECLVVGHRRPGRRQGAVAR
jgi:glycosyltransferase involved in cell wall biosynthesis